MIAIICFDCRSGRHDSCTECPCQHRDPNTVTIITTPPELPTPSKDES